MNIFDSKDSNKKICTLENIRIVATNSDLNVRNRNYELEDTKQVK